MLWVSFAYTTPALLAGRKSCTRRHWQPGHARRFQAGATVTAYDRRPDHGGQPVAVLRLTQDAREEPDSATPDSDYEAEGFPYLLSCTHLLPRTIQAQVAQGLWSAAWFRQWRLAGGRSHVVRFEVLEYLNREGMDRFPAVAGLWQAARRGLATERRVAALLKATEPLLLDGDTLVLAVAYEFHRERLSDPAVSAAVERALTAVAGRPLRCRFVQQGALVAASR